MNMKATLYIAGVLKDSVEIVDGGVFGNFVCGSIEEVTKQLAKMQAELEGLGCNVEITMKIEKC